jgi:RNA polymerase sigma-B factor
MTASKHHDAHQHENNNEDLRERNLALLASYALRRDPRQRNRLVELNLPLVRKIAHQESLRTDLPFEDLVQEGALGLIRAVEAFDPSRQTALSSFAVPYIRGAMRHYLRDRHLPLRAPRRLRELHARGQALQQKRLHAGESPLAEAALAEALDCSAAEWQEAMAVHRALQVRSLDAPQTDGEGGLTTLLDQLEALASDPADGQPDGWWGGLSASPSEGEPHQVLLRVLEQLDPPLRHLLEGRVLYGATWSELGETLGMHARMARRRFETLVEQLRAELRPLHP